MGSAGRALALDADRAAALYNVSATPEGHLQPFVATVARVAAPQPFPSHRITIPLPLVDASQAGSGPAHDGSLLGRGRLGEGAQTGVLFLRPSPHRAQGRSQYVAVPSPTPPAGPGGGSAGPQGPSNLPPLPFPLSNLQQRAGARPGVDPLALKLGYFPLPFVEKYLAEVSALQAQIAGLQGDLQGVKARLQAANGWVTNAVGAVTSLTGKSYGGASFDSTIADIPTDLTNLQVMIAGIEHAGDPSNSQNFRVWDLFNGKFLTYLQQAIAATSQQLTGLENRLGSAQTFLNGLLTPMEQLVGASYGPRSFDARPLTGLPQDLANAIGPSGMGKVLAYGGSLTGKTYGLPDLWNGNLLGDVKGYITGIVTGIKGDINTLNAEVQKITGAAANAVRYFVGALHLGNLNPESHVVSQFGSQYQLTDPWGEMSGSGVGPDLPSTDPSGPYDGWDGDTLAMNANTWQGSQYDAVRKRPRTIGEVLTRPFARARQERAARMMDAGPTGINPADFQHQIIYNYGDGTGAGPFMSKSDGSTQGSSKALVSSENAPGGQYNAPGTWLPSLSHTVTDTKLGSAFQRLHNMRALRIARIPASLNVVNIGAISGGAGNNRIIQALDRQGNPIPNCRILGVVKAGTNRSDFGGPQSTGAPGTTVKVGSTTYPLATIWSWDGSGGKFRAMALRNPIKANHEESW